MDVRVLHGTPAAPGIAIGTVVHYGRRTGTAESTRIEPERVDREVAALEQAVEAVRADLRRDMDIVGKRAGPDEAAIFDAHLLMLDDPALVGEIARRIQDDQMAASAATHAVADELVAVFDTLDDDYLRARASDVRDVSGRILLALNSDATPALEISDDTIIVADELFPSDTSRLNLDHVVGFVTERGSRTAHIAILARALDIALIVGVQDALSAIENGALAIVDGDTGDLSLSPTREQIANARQTESEQRAQRARRSELVAVPAVTVDGTSVSLLANIGTVAEARAARENGSEGIGLFRTEFMYGGRDALPDEDEQVTVYRTVAELFAPLPVVIRTLDAGGDKPVPGITVPGLDDEMNPFLGLRGLRLSLATPDVFVTQLRAILRAATVGNVWVMFPMVTALEELRQARALLDRAARALQEQGVDYSDDIRVGMMVEVPAAAIIADHFAPEVDFFSIGTNDLTQYTLAADRTNASVAERYDALHPAVLRLIRGVVSAGTAHGRHVAVCGELAGDTTAIPTLIGLGVRELSMTATSIPDVKATIRAMTLGDAETDAARRESSTN
jgi:phosphotransferase system enzyme I (PtsI)